MILFLKKCIHKHRIFFVTDGAAEELCRKCRIKSCCPSRSLQEARDNFALEKVKVSSSYPVFSPICCCKCRHYYLHSTSYLGITVQLVEIGICEKWHRAQCCIFNTVKGSISKGVRLKYRTKNNNITYSKQTVCQAIHMGISRINLFFRIKKVTLMMMLLPDMERIKSFGT